MKDTERTSIYRLADIRFRVTATDQKLYSFLSAYSAFDQSDLTVGITPSDIAFERTHADHPSYSNAYLGTLALYRKIAEKLPEYDGFVFHGSAIALDGKGYIFTAKSGTGKSTHARLWRELLGDRAMMVNDDKPIIRFLNGAPYVFGTPWDGKHHLSSNIAVPLKTVCILEQAAENSIREITKQDALPMVIQQAYRPSDPAALAKTLALIDRMQVKYYQLACNMDIAAARLSYETMAH